jgi:nucleotide-binding universal stress UspA family protein
MMMSYKSMTVCLDNSAGSSRVLDFALNLAAQKNAHLTGLHLTYAPIILSDPYAVWEPMMLEWEESAQTKQEHVREKFISAAAKAGVSADFSAYRSTDLQAVIAHARASDLTIVGQRNLGDSETDLGNNFPVSFVLKLGRPVLFIPTGSQASPKFNTIIVAWDGGREATRAMADAMPFLKLAERVKILSISERTDDDHDLPDIDIAAYLAKHDVKVEIERNENVHIAPAEWLLSKAANCGADLLVMGAYGHNRLTELILGGVTRSVMRQMTLPVLMSH